MKILINGKSKALSNREIRHAVRFFASHLFRRSPNIEIRITFKDMKHVADCAPDSSDHTVFHIDVSNRESTPRTRKALAHEMTHVRQYVSGDLSDYERFPNKVRWQGKRFSYTDAADATYWLSPWEIEAHGYEIGLYKLYMKERRRQLRRA